MLRRLQFGVASAWRVCVPPSRWPPFSSVFCRHFPNSVRHSSPPCTKRPGRLQQGSLPLLSCHPAPLLSSPVLPDDCPLSDGVSYILLHLRKPAPNAHPAILAACTPDACAAFAAAITAQTGVSSIGELRAFTDADFRALEVPAMLRIYLKHLVRGTQSGRAIGGKAANAAAGVDPAMLSLMNDFNYGQPFDLSLYSSQLSQLALMGFDSTVGLEALLMVENRSVEAACEMLLMNDAAQRKEKRAKVVERLGRQARAGRSNEAAVAAAQALSRSQRPDDGAAAAAAAAAQEKADASAAALLAMQSDLAAVRSTLAREKSHRLAQTAELSAFLSTTLPTTLYTEFLKSILVKEYVLPMEVEQLAVFRAKNNISLEQHAAILGALGFSPPSSFDALVRKTDRNQGGGPGGASVGGNQQQPGDMDCVVCLDKPKNHIIMNWSTEQTTLSEWNDE